MSSSRAADNDVIPPLFNTLVSGAIATLRGHVKHARPEVRWLARFGWLLIATGLFHVLVWLADGLPALGGPTGWRKPIVFGLSGGLTSLSVAALQARTRETGRWWLVYVVAMALEVALIDLQAWRGVGSHFNVATALDGAIFTLMGVLILIAMTAAIVIGVRATKGPPDAAQATASGLATFALGLGTLVGIAMSVHGSIALQTGGVPSRVGAAGDWKLVHSLALHGLQLFPVLAWWLEARGADVVERLRSLRLAGAGWALGWAASVVQLVQGRAPMELSVGAAALVGASGVLLALAVVWPRRPRAVHVAEAVAR